MFVDGAGERSPRGARAGARGRGGRAGAAPHLRDHLAPRRRQDDAHREAPAVLGRDPPGRRGQDARRSPAHALRLDGDRAPARHLGVELGDELRAPGPGLQPAGHAGPRGLFRGHLSHAHRGRFGDHGDRRRQGHRGADAQAVRGLPAARRADHDLHQQDRSRGARPVRAAGRDRADARPRRGAGDLAGRHGDRIPRQLRAAPRPAAAAERGGRGGARDGLRRDRRSGARPAGRRGHADRLPRRRGAGAAGLPQARHRGLSRGPSEPGLFRQRAQGLRGRRPARRPRPFCAAAAARSRPSRARSVRRSPR